MYNIIVIGDADGELNRLIDILKDLGCSVLRVSNAGTIEKLYFPIDAVIVSNSIDEDNIKDTKELNKNIPIWNLKDLDLTNGVAETFIKEFLDGLYLRRKVDVLESKLGDAYKELEKANEYVLDSNLEVIYALAEMAESRDRYAEGHLLRVQEICFLMLMNLNDTPYEDFATRENVYKMTELSILHDIGKVSIPDEILNKPSKLTTEEFEVMKTHVEIGEKIIKNIIMNLTNGYRNEYLEAALDIVSNHHEKWDGTGYPRGKKGEEIPLLARIMAIADVYDALRSERPYKEAMCHEDAIKIIVDNKGKHFDPIITEVFLSNSKEINQVYTSYNK